MTEKATIRVLMFVFALLHNSLLEVKCVRGEKIRLAGPLNELYTSLGCCFSTSNRGVVGYHICLTHRRSPVRFRAIAQIFFHWALSSSSHFFCLWIHLGPVFRELSLPRVSARTGRVTPKQRLPAIKSTLLLHSALLTISTLFILSLIICS
jgi:hypothetical protein